MASDTLTPHAAGIWLDEVTPRSLLRAGRLTSGTDRLVSCQSTPNRWATQLWARFAGVAVQPLRYELGDLRTPSGQGLRYAIEETLIEWVAPRVANLLHETGLSDTLPGLDPDRVRTYLLKEAGARVLPALTLGYVASALYPKHARPLLLIGSDAAAILAGHPQFEGLRVETYGRPRRTRLGRWMCGLLGLARAAAGVAAWNARRLTVSSIPDTPQIAVQISTRPDRATSSDIPWFDGSGLGRDQVLLFADRRDQPLDQEAVDFIEAAGHRWADCGKGLRRRRNAGRWVGLCVERPVTTLLTAVRAIARAAGSDSPLVEWELAHRLRLVWLVAQWEAWCRRLRVAAFLQYATTGTLMIAQTLAVERAGGIAFGWQWSHFSFDSLGHARDLTVYFSWGPYYRDGFLRERSRIHYLVYTGHLWLFPLDRARGHALREQLRQAGATYVACLFDSSFGPHIHYSDAAARSVYAPLLEEVVRQPSFGLVMKPKNDVRSWLASLPVFAAAEATGRCVLLDWHVAPRTAAASADFVIGFGFNSAAVEAAAAGGPAIHVDVSGDGSNPLHRRGRDAWTFESAEAAMTAMRQHRLHGSASGIGDHTRQLEILTAFRHGDGHARMGAFLNTFMDRINQGRTASAALEDAALEYRRRFGADAIASFEADADARDREAC